MFENKAVWPKATRGAEGPIGVSCLIVRPKCSKEEARCIKEEAQRKPEEAQSKTGGGPTQNRRRPKANPEEAQSKLEEAQSKREEAQSKRDPFASGLREEARWRPKANRKGGPKQTRRGPKQKNPVFFDFAFASGLLFFYFLF